MARPELEVPLRATAATSNFVAARPRYTSYDVDPETARSPFTPMFRATGFTRFVGSTAGHVGAGVPNVPTWSGDWRSGADPAPDHPSPAEPPILIDLS